jgi:hypothetical protein
MCWVIFIERNGWLDDVLYEHARWGLSATRPELGEGVGRFIVASRDVMKFKVINFRLELPYLLAVCRHVGAWQFDSPMTWLTTSSESSQMRMLLTRASYSATLFIG